LVSLLAAMPKLQLTVAPFDPRRPVRVLMRQRRIIRHVFDERTERRHLDMVISL
jgi:hypothetical protein